MKTIRITWTRNDEAIGKHFERLASHLLSADEYTRLSLYTRASDRQLSLLAKIILFHELETHDIHLSDLKQFTADTWGKPFLRSHPDIQFSISHSGRIAAVAIASGRRIGIDLEDVNRGGLEDVASEFTAQERRWIHADPQRLLQLWTRKEAILKAGGLGLQHEPVTIDVLQNPVKLGATNFFWQDLHLEEDYVGTVAEERATSPLKFSFLSVDDSFLETFFKKLHADQ